MYGDRFDQFICSRIVTPQEYKSIVQHHDQNLARAFDEQMERIEYPLKSHHEMYALLV